VLKHQNCKNFNNKSLVSLLWYLPTPVGPVTTNLAEVIDVLVSRPIRGTTALPDADGWEVLPRGAPVSSGESEEVAGEDGEGG
jgi:hypothetical protein